MASNRWITARKLIDPSFLADVDAIAAEMTDILFGRQMDYGPGNINNAFGGPINGLLVRMGDKYERIKNLVATNTDPRGERLEDSFIDLANYCIIALMVMRGQWPQQGGHQCTNETTNDTQQNAAASTPSPSN